MTKTNDAISDLQSVLNDKDVGALEKLVYIKRAETELDKIKAANMKAANLQYAELKKTENGNKFHVILGGLATVSDFVLRARWEYPVHIMTLETELKRAQKDAQVKGLARNVAVFDIATSQSFSIRLAEK